MGYNTTQQLLQCPADAIWLRLNAILLVQVNDEGKVHAAHNHTDVITELTY